MKHMRNRRCADKEGITLEEIKYGPEELHVEVLLLFNKMIESGTTEGSWRNIMFHMIAKSGERSFLGDELQTYCYSASAVSNFLQDVLLAIA